METIKGKDFSGKKILIRGDLDILLDKDDLRFKSLCQSVSALLSSGAQAVYILSHRGRPESRQEEFSLAGFVELISQECGVEAAFIENVEEFLSNGVDGSSKVSVFENIRFMPQEEENSSEFSDKLCAHFDVYVNESFATSHRKHMSVDALPRAFRKNSKSVYAGLRFVDEIDNLKKIFGDAKRPVVSLISGVKEDKLEYIEKFKDFSDVVLVGGRLPLFMDENVSDPKVVVARLLPDKEDITIHSIEKFSEYVLGAGTVILSGPLGKYEEEGHRLGTQRVLEAISKSGAYRIAGGGDTERAITSLGFADSFDWISCGGGAMLYFLSFRTLPGILALVD